MSIAICLLLYGFTVAVLAPQLLRRSIRVGAAPRLGVAAWMSAIVSVGASWAFGLAILLVDVTQDLLQPGGSRVVGNCLLELHEAAAGRYGVVVQTGILTLSALASVAGVVLAARLISALLRARRTTHEHARMVRVAGRHNAELDAVVLDLDEPVAYCVAGRPHAVVVTRGVISSLDGRHLEAVLAHERAHLAGRHHVLLALTRGLAAVFPRSELFRVGAIEVAHLIEMCADDAAARIHGHHTVRQALLMLSGAPDPADALGAAGVGLAARVERLTMPARPEQRTRARLQLSVATAIVIIAPLVAALLSVLGIAICGPSDRFADGYETGVPDAAFSHALRRLGCGAHSSVAAPGTDHLAIPARTSTH